MEKCYFQLSYMWKLATLLKVTLLHECFSRFLNCTSSTKNITFNLISSISGKESQDIQLLVGVSSCSSPASNKDNTNTTKHYTIRI